MSKNNNTLILFNELIIDIINDKKYFNKVEYENIKKINNNCNINDEDDCLTTIKNKLDMQHYIFYFLYNEIVLLLFAIFKIVLK